MVDVNLPTQSEPEGASGRCPACGGAVLFPPGAVVGEALWCGACGAELEVRGLNPALLDFYEEEEK